MIYVALLYSIILGAGRRLVMSDLKAIANDVGFKHPRTLLATGNLLFEADDQPVAELERKLEKAFAATLGKHIDIIIRSAPDWQRLAASNPFPVESAAHGDRVCVRVMRQPLSDAGWKLVQDKAGDAEVRCTNGDLWVAFPDQTSTMRLVSHLTTKKLDVGTLRNWNTVHRISEAL